MRLFQKRRKDAEQDNYPSLSDKASVKIAGAIKKIQGYFTECMNQLFKNLNKAQLRAMLFLFCTGTGSFSIYLVVNAALNTDKAHSGFKIKQFVVPKHYNQPKDESVPEATIDEITFFKIHDFKKYMDSLKENRHLQYDSILQARPGLMDSVQMLEEIYYSQKQK